jgi:hypothetical protein
VVHIKLCKPAENQLQTHLCYLDSEKKRDVLLAHDVFVGIYRSLLVSFLNATGDLYHFY